MEKSKTKLTETEANLHYPRHHFGSSQIVTALELDGVRIHQEIWYFKGFGLLLAANIHGYIVQTCFNDRLRRPFGFLFNVGRGFLHSSFSNHHPLR